MLYEEYFNYGVLTVIEISEQLNISRSIYYQYSRHLGY